VLALALKVLIPAGFMVARGDAGLPVPLVICTAQGTTTIDGRRIGHDGDPSKPMADDQVCAFAGHAGGAAAPEPQASATITLIAYTAAAEPFATSGVAPGRGLAAPPLPARGPPA
jgi:hypothetical protein